MAVIPWPRSGADSSGGNKPVGAAPASGPAKAPKPAESKAEDAGPIKLKLKVDNAKQPKPLIGPLLFQPGASPLVLGARRYRGAIIARPAWALRNPRTATITMASTTKQR